jgi:hypothetical protein
MRVGQQHVLPLPDESKMSERDNVGGTSRVPRWNGPREGKEREGRGDKRYHGGGDYLTDLFPILELGTSAKMLSPKLRI